MGMMNSSEKLTNLKKTHQKHTDSLVNIILTKEKDHDFLNDSLSEMKDSIQILNTLIEEKEKVKQKNKALQQKSQPK